MLRKKELKFIRNLLLVSLIFLNGCAQEVSESVDFCPVWQVAGKEVADELEKAGDLPKTWEWLSRLDKLREELELCQKEIKK